MSAVVSDITPVRTGARARVISLDGAPWRTTSAAAIKLLGLAEGDIVDPVRLAGQLDACEQQAVRERALALLGYRERSEKELRHKLAQDGYADDAIDDVVEAFVRTGLVDDQRLADALARSAAGTKALGRRRAARVLAERGIGGDAAAVVLDRYLPEGHELPRAVELAKRLIRPGEPVERLAARLARKGFDTSTAFAAARTAAADAGAPAGDDWFEPSP